MEMRRLCTLFLLCLSLSFSLHAETVRIATPVFAPPFVINAKHYVLQGFDIAFMNLICNRLHWQCQYVAIQDNDLFSALDQNKTDFAMGGLVITDERSALYKFSLPYLPSSAGIVFLKQKNYKTLADLKNKRIGSINGTIYNGYLHQSFPIQVKPHTYNYYDELILALTNGDIDAAFVNYYSALFFAHQYPGLVQALNEHIDFGLGIGIAALSNKADKIEQINRVILEFQANGTFVRLYSYYFQFFTQKNE